MLTGPDGVFRMKQRHFFPKDPLAIEDRNRDVGGARSSLLFGGEGVLIHAPPPTRVNSQDFHALTEVREEPTEGSSLALAGTGQHHHWTGPCRPYQAGLNITRYPHMLDIRRERIFCKQVQLASIVAMVTACDTVTNPTGQGRPAS